MSDSVQAQVEDSSAEDQIANESQQTLTFDGRSYAMESLPPEAINVLNDLIRSENELNEHRFRMRQLSAAQQSLTLALGQLIQAAGVEPLSDAGESNPLVGDDSKDMEAAWSLYGWSLNLIVFQVIPSLINFFIEKYIYLICLFFIVDSAGS